MATRTEHVAWLAAEATSHHAVNCLWLTANCTFYLATGVNLAYSASEHVARVLHQRRRCIARPPLAAPGAPQHCHMCVGTGLAHSPHLHRDWGHRCHIFIRAGLAPSHVRRDWACPQPTSSSGLGSSLPHLHPGWPRPVTCASGLGAPLTEMRTEFATAAKAHNRYRNMLAMFEEIPVKPAPQLRGSVRALRVVRIIDTMRPLPAVLPGKGSEAALRTYNSNHFGRQHAAYETRRAGQTDAASSRSLRAVGATCCGRSTACPVRGFRLRGQAPHVDPSPGRRERQQAVAETISGARAFAWAR